MTTPLNNQTENPYWLTNFNTPELPDYRNLMSGIGVQAKDLRNQFETTFGNNRVVDGTRDFLESNTLVAKAAFLFIVVFVFMFLLRIGTGIISSMLSPSESPVLVTGMKDAKKPLVIPQNPAVAHSIPIKRSVDEQHGIEFSYSLWMFIDDLVYKQGQYKHVFHKGNDDFVMDGDQKGMNQPNNAPGVYLDKYTNHLIIMMNTYKNINEKVVVKDIPLNKWIHLVLRIEGKNLDVYINGTIVHRHRFTSVPKQNYGDFYVNMNGGYSGYLSRLQYFDYGLSIREIQNQLASGADRTMDDSAMKVKPPYFSLRWYFNQ